MVSGQWSGESIDRLGERSVALWRYPSSVEELLLSLCQNLRTLSAVTAACRWRAAAFLFGGVSPLVGATLVDVAINVVLVKTRRTRGLHPDERGTRARSAVDSCMPCTILAGQIFFGVRKINSARDNRLEYCGEAVQIGDFGPKLLKMANSQAPV
ncbi:hypothetical protein B0H14DRAFT_3130220 [Mycena olivaceomarginata]|nr:hypothetical protein B0H14DRAFT_3130220 [Mycena olivaceomarginata]